MTGFDLVRSVLGCVGVDCDTMRREDWLTFVLLQVPPGELITAAVDDDLAQCVTEKEKQPPLCN